MQVTALPWDYASYTRATVELLIDHQAVDVSIRLYGAGYLDNPDVVPEEANNIQISIRIDKPWYCH